MIHILKHSSVRNTFESSALKLIGYTEFAPESMFPFLKILKNKACQSFDGFYHKYRNVMPESDVSLEQEVIIFKFIFQWSFPGQFQIFLKYRIETKLLHRVG